MCFTVAGLGVSSSCQRDRLCVAIAGFGGHIGGSHSRGNKLILRGTVASIDSDNL